ncbi:hypothetical protein ACFQ4O_01790 [Methylopila musalis]|uniref:Uncharacterized protein n=1 Tax=Methylopila musalis TaxID=1134781 RepID=A0ABW3Z3F8_9HYPH
MSANAAPPRTPPLDHDAAEVIAGRLFDDEALRDRVCEILRERGAFVVTDLADADPDEMAELVAGAVDQNELSSHATESLLLSLGLKPGAQDVAAEALAAIRCGRMDEAAHLIERGFDTASVDAAQHLHRYRSRA